MKTHKLNLLFILLVLIFSNCDDYTNVDYPRNQLTKKNVFEDQQTALSALNFIYSQIREYSLMSGNSNGSTVICSIYSDDLDYHTTIINDYSNLFNHTQSASSNLINSIWVNNYNILYNINAYIEGINQSTKLNEEFKNQTLGEVLTLRAIIHFNLSNLFGDIPYITSTDYIANNKIKKTKQKQVHAQVIQELNLASSLLNEMYPTILKTRINKSSCQTFLARAYLYDKQWQKAIQIATDIINKKSLYNLESVDKLFLKESNSTIWQLHSGISGGNTKEAMTFIINTSPATYSLSEQLISSFLEEDQRLNHWTKKLESKKIPYKYKENLNTNISKEYSIVLRLEELYLIRAEAYAHNISTLDKALEDLNSIHLKYNKSPLYFNNQSDLLEAIYQQRQLEFFTEQGHRWYDLVRTNRAQSTLSQLKQNWKEEDILLPIPIKEITINPNLLPQNDGY